MNRLSLLFFHIFALLLAFLPSLTTRADELPAFPGAEGGGRYTTGGRGGTVFFVTSLADTNTGDSKTHCGTLRWCVGQSGKRTILFRVSGIIELKSRLNIKNGDLTIAGQSAPGDGICLKDNSVCIQADNVIIRYMRFRPGDANPDFEDDAIWGRYQKNIILDHCSMSFSVDECASFYANQNFTMQWCLLSESLRCSLHDKGNHGYGGLWGGENASFHHNMLAHHDSRNARLNGWQRKGLSYSHGNTSEERVDYRNNVVYNWGSNSTYGGEAAGKYNIVNNYYRYGPATNQGVRSRLVQMDKDEKSFVIDVNGTNVTTNHGIYYISGNYMWGNATVTNNNWSTSGIKNNTGEDLSKCRTNTPFEFEAIPTHTAEQAFEKVLAYAGACLARDAQDARVAYEAEEGTYTFEGSKGGTKGIIDTPDDVGGYCTYSQTAAPKDTDSDGIPDAWEFSHDLSHTDASDASEYADDGYTWLEHYLNDLVADITAAQYEGATINGVPLSVGSSFLEEQQGSLRSCDGTPADVILSPDAEGRISIRASRPVKHVAILSPAGSLLAAKTMPDNTTRDIVLAPAVATPSILIIRVTLTDGTILTGKCRL
ncbi:MAG: pectate lyase [Bacteroidaceae bacterium]|nr:pectate lyase [Bacteroidaceae bacterium]